MMIIVDSGGTKADWCLVKNGNVVASLTTQGITPVHQTEQTIRGIIRQELLADGTFASAIFPQSASLGLLHVTAANNPRQSIAAHFYGSGCIPEKAAWLKSILDDEFSHFGITFQVYNDLLGAARALCGHAPGIACILGTGANSCLYDGENIVANTPPLGYILGDEGSGAYLGRRFLNGIFKGWLGKKLLDEYLEWSGLRYSDIIAKVYRQPMANKYLASIAPFIKSRIDFYPSLDKMAVDSFREFLRLNLSKYEKDNLAVSFTGGIANAFSVQLAKAVDAEHYRIGSIVDKPILNLVKFHSSFA